MENTLGTHRVLHLTANLPGPIAAAHLAETGISVTKIEAPEGDPLEKHDPQWYRSLHRAQTIVRLDLKDQAQRQKMDALLSESHVFMASVRPASLKKLGLDPESLAARFPKLHVVMIQGYPAPDENVPAHDLTCQATAGLVAPPNLPRALIADFAVAERVVSKCLLALLRASHGMAGTAEVVTMSGMAEEFAAPWKRNLTTPEGPLGGAHPGYGLYRAKDGWIALAALEPHFMEKLVSGLGLPRADANELARAFAAETREHWQRFAEKAGIPLVALD